MAVFCLSVVCELLSDDKLAVSRLPSDSNPFDEGDGNRSAGWSLFHFDLL